MINRQRVLWVGVGLVLLCTGLTYLAASVFGLLRFSGRGPYLQSVTLDSVWVVWDTRASEVGQVEYGLNRQLGLVVRDEQEVAHHELQLMGLTPYTRYFYRVDGRSIASFLTAASGEQTSFRFAVFGDTRENFFVHRAIVKRIQDASPDFVLHTGDMVEFGDCGSCWDDFFRAEAPLLRSAPFFPTLGNHEDDQSPYAGTDYFNIFHLPGIERWYAFDYGNARFISLKADGYPANTYYPVQEQLDWLENELAGNDKAWTFVFFHWGVYTSRGEDFLETGMRARLVPLFERYGVNAVFMGHNHGYERVEVNGITYLTTAGGGASLYELSIPEPGSRAEARAYHFMMVEVDGERLTAKAIDRYGKTIDRFELVAGK